MCVGSQPTLGGELQNRLIEFHGTIGRCLPHSATQCCLRRPSQRARRQHFLP